MADRAMVLKSDGVLHTQVVIRIETPPGDNLVGVAWVTAAGQEYNQRKAIDQDVGSRWPGEDDSELSNGSSVEVVRTWKLNVENPDASTQAKLAVWLGKTVTEEKARLERQLNFWGKVLP